MVRTKCGYAGALSDWLSSVAVHDKPARMTRGGGAKWFDGIPPLAGCTSQHHRFRRRDEAVRGTWRVRLIPVRRDNF
jgi:hypothetical protein